MKEYVIVTDSACDLPVEYAKEKNLEVVNLKFNLKGKEYINDLAFTSMSATDFYQHLRDGEASKTTQVNVDQFISVYKKILDSGKDVFMITLSSGLSGTNNSARLAKEIVLKDYPDSNIILIDSLGGSLGEGLMVMEAIKMKEAGKTVFETETHINTFRMHVVHVFTLDDLTHLALGGRIGKFSFWLGTALRIKPIITANEKGILRPKNKILGRKKSINMLVDHVVQTYTGIYNQDIMIAHADCLEEAEKVASMIEEKLHVKPKLNMMGTVIGSHGGPGTIAIFYTADKR